MANFEKNKIEKIFLNRMKSWDRSINIDNHSFILPYRTYNNILINSPLKQDYLNLLSSKFGNIVFVLRQNDSDSWEEKPLSSLKKLRSDRDKFLFFHDANKNIFQVSKKSPILNMDIENINYNSNYSKKFTDNGYLTSDGLFNIRKNIFLKKKQLATRSYY